jgi:predicted DNA-binding transcriptional regulator AlpA
MAILLRRVAIFRLTSQAATSLSLSPRYFARFREHRSGDINMGFEGKSFPRELLPIARVEDVTGSKKSKVYHGVRQGTFVPPIKCGSSSRWVSTEIQALVDFRIQKGNPSDDELKEFVRSLVAHRQTLLAVAA